MKIKTEQDLCKQALLVQDACNSGGVSHLLREAMEFLVMHRDIGTGDKNKHPAVRLIIAKLADLAWMDYSYPQADHDYCVKKAAEKELETI